VSGGNVNQWWLVLWYCRSEAVCTIHPHQLSYFLWAYLGRHKASTNSPQTPQHSIETTMQTQNTHPGCRRCSVQFLCGTCHHTGQCTRPSSGTSLRVVFNYGWRCAMSIALLSAALNVCFFIWITFHDIIGYYTFVVLASFIGIHTLSHDLRAFYFLACTYPESC